MLFSQIEIRTIDISYFKHLGIMMQVLSYVPFLLSFLMNDKNNQEISRIACFTHKIDLLKLSFYIFIYNWLSNFCFRIICLSFSTRKFSNHMKIRTMLIQTNSNYNLLIVFVRILNCKTQQPFSYRKKCDSTSLGNCITKGKKNKVRSFIKKSLWLIKCRNTVNIETKKLPTML